MYLAASFLTLITGLPRRAKNARLKSTTEAEVPAEAVGPARTRDSMDSSGTMAGLTRFPDSYDRDRVVQKADILESLQTE